MGKIYDKNAFFLHERIGTAEKGDKGYTMMMLIGGCPAVRSETTGKVYAVGWDELLDQAVLAGVDE